MLKNKSANSNAKPLVTPQGTTMFASLLKGTVFGGEPTAMQPGHLETLLVLDPRKEEVQEFYANLNNACRDLIQEASGRPYDELVAAGQVAEIPYNLKPDVDEAKNPTGMDRLKLRRTAGGVRPDGSTFTNSIDFCDSQRQPIQLEEELGNGSIIKAIIAPYCYHNGKFGISLQLKTVQVIEARKRPQGGQGGDPFAMFDVVEPKPLNTNQGADF